MKKILFLAIAGVLFLTGCEDFLDSENLTKKNSENFPVNETDAQQLLTAVYATLNSPVSDCGTSYFLTAEVASDDRFGGGGENDKDFQAADHLMYTNVNRFSTFWTERYKGVNRANMAIANLGNVADEDLRNQKMGEALFLRAFSYFELTKMFGDIPFIEKAPDNVEEAKQAPQQMDAQEIYKFIGSDLWEAYSIMPSYKWNEVSSGTVTKWAAAGLLARVYLFYTGFYEQPSLPLTDGTSLSAAQVAAALEDCIENSEHGLVDDYRSLWSYSNKVSKKDYPYVEDADEWVRDGQNKEHVFAIKFSYLAGWPANGVTGYSNQYCLFFGIRGAGDDKQFINLFPFGQGWGSGPVNPALWEEWETDEPDDPRREASILNGNETTDYIYGADSQMEESGFWQKKYVATTAYKNKEKGDLYNSFTSTSDYYGDGERDDFQCSHSVDLAVIRYADILLMHSELTGTADGMNEVRSRVDLPAVEYSLENIQKERRYELAFEGVRWGDIRRWRIAETVLANQLNQPIYNRGIATVMKDQGAGYVSRYSITKGFMPIPQSEIDLSNGALVQNPGWDNSAVFSNWND